MSDAAAVLDELEAKLAAGRRALPEGGGDGELWRVMTRYGEAARRYVQGEVPTPFAGLDAPGGAPDAGGAVPPPPADATAPDAEPEAADDGDLAAFFEDYLRAITRAAGYEDEGWSLRIRPWEAYESLQGIFGQVEDLVPDFLRAMLERTSVGEMRAWGGTVSGAADAAQTGVTAFRAVSFALNPAAFLLGRLKWYVAMLPLGAVVRRGIGTFVQGLLVTLGLEWLRLIRPEAVESRKGVQLRWLLDAFLEIWADAARGTGQDPDPPDELRLRLLEIVAAHPDLTAREKHRFLLRLCAPLAAGGAPAPRLTAAGQVALIADAHRVAAVLHLPELGARLEGRIRQECRPVELSRAAVAAEAAPRENGRLLADLRLLEDALLDLPSFVPMRESFLGWIAVMRRDLSGQAEAPRVVLVGRAGAGKSSFLNAFFGRPLRPVGDHLPETLVARWERFDTRRGSLDFLDTRGLYEGFRPGEDPAGAAPLAALAAAIETRAADVIVMVVPAVAPTKEAGRVLEEARALAALRARLQRDTGLQVPVLPVLSKADRLLRSPRMRLPGDADEAFLAAVAAQEAALRGLLDRAGLPAARPVSGAFAVRWDDAGAPLPGEDLRWNTAAVFRGLIRLLPEPAALKMTRMAHVRSLQAEMAGTVLGCFAGVAAPVGLAGAGAVESLQRVMLALLARLYGRDLDDAGVEALRVELSAEVVSLGVPLARKLGAAVKHPAARPLLAGAAAANSTYQLGTLAQKRFEGDSQEGAGDGR